jgi:hypothetical protein
MDTNTKDHVSTPNVSIIHRPGKGCEAMSGFGLFENLAATFTTTKDGTSYAVGDAVCVAMNIDGPGKDGSFSLQTLSMPATSI